MHLAPLLHDLATILVVAGLVTVIFRKIHQPLVLGYLTAGVIIGPFTPPHPLVTDLPNIKTLAELGVIFLMFSIGLDFSFHRLRRMGPQAGTIAFAEILMMCAIGYFVGGFLGWNTTDRLFLAGMLAISSTSIIFKTLHELGLTARQFAEIVFGILVVEDLAAILLLVGLNTLSVPGEYVLFRLLMAAGKLCLIVGSWFIVGYFLIPILFRYAARWLDDETLTVASTGLCLLLVVIATHFGYSAALGAFIMGSILAETPLATRIETLIRPLRDLFGAVFFVSVGMLVDPKILVENSSIVLLLTAVVIVGKFASVTISALLSGQPPRRSIQVGMTLTQIGEFSFIIAANGAALGVISPFLYTYAVSVSVITAFTTPYLVRAAEPLCDFLRKTIPMPWQEPFRRYSQSRQNARAVDQRPFEFGRSLAQFLLNGLLVSAILLSAVEYGLPWIRQTFPNLRFERLWVWTAAMILSAPFLWAMMAAFRSRTEDNSGLKLLGQLLTVVCVGAISQVFFSVSISMILVALMFCALSLFFPRLEKFYRRLEGKLISNLAETKSQLDSVTSSLGRWDLFLSPLRVHPNSSLAGKTLGECAVRAKFGINIIIIKRGERVIMSPAAGERIFPSDELLLLGTDDEIGRMRVAVEKPAAAGPDTNLAEYSLMHINIDEHSPLVGETLKSSSIRTKVGGLVVGLERASRRTINPEANTRLQAGDTLLVVANSS